MFRALVTCIAFLHAQVEWLPDQSLIQTVKAVPKFRCKPWFDSVAIAVAGGVEYALLQALFRCGLWCRSSVWGSSGGVMEWCCMTSSSVQKSCT